MRVFSITFSLWYDEHWAKHIKKSWKKPAYWIKFRPEKVRDGMSTLTVDFFCFDLKFILRGANG